MAFCLPKLISTVLEALPNIKIESLLTERSGATIFAIRNPDIGNQPRSLGRETCEQVTSFLLCSSALLASDCSGNTVTVSAPRWQRKTTPAVPRKDRAGQGKVVDGVAAAVQAAPKPIPPSVCQGVVVEKVKRGFGSMWLQQTLQAGLD